MGIFVDNSTVSSIYLYGFEVFPARSLEKVSADRERSEWNTRCKAPEKNANVKELPFFS